MRYLYLDNYSLSDLAAVTKDNDGFGGGGGAWWIIILFLFVFMGGGAFGGARNAYESCATQGQMTDQFNFEALRAGQNDVAATVKDVAYNNLVNIRDLQAAVAANGYNASQCCCETNRNIDSVKFDMANYACAVQQNDTANTQKILDAITGNRMADMQNEIHQLQLNAALCGIPRITNYAYGVTPLNWCNAASACGYNSCGC